MEAPVIQNCSGNLSVTTDASQPFATIVLDDPGFSDNSGNFSVNSTDSSSWSEFPVGSTEVLYIVEDPSSNTNECMFTIEVRGKVFDEQTWVEL